LSIWKRVIQHRLDRVLQTACVSGNLKAAFYGIGGIAVNNATGLSIIPVHWMPTHLACVSNVSAELHRLTGRGKTVVSKDPSGELVASFPIA